jgi:hypothetical protein
LDYAHNNIELAVAAVATAELRELSLRVPSASTSPTMPPSSGAFKDAEDAKAVQIDADDLAKIVQIGIDLNPKASSSTSFDATRTYLCGVQQKCQPSPERSPSTPSTSSPAQIRSSRAYDALIRKSTEPWEKSYPGSWLLDLLKRSSTQIG